MGRLRSKLVLSVFFLVAKKKSIIVSFQKDNPDLTAASSVGVATAKGQANHFFASRNIEGLRETKLTVSLGTSH